MNIMSELEKDLERAKAAQGEDERLAHVMTDMERKYEIPMLAKSLPDWVAQNSSAERILKTYRYISNIRSK